jgi:hypothetical protein
MSGLNVWCLQSKSLGAILENQELDAEGKKYIYIYNNYIL